MSRAWPMAAASAAAAVLASAAGSALAQEVEDVTLASAGSTLEPPPAFGAAPSTPAAEAPGPYPAVDSAALARQPEADDWRFTLTPYVFVPTMDGTLRFDPPPADDGEPLVSVSPADVLKALNLAFMISADVHYRRFGVMTDVIYVDLGAEQAKVDQIIRPGGVIAVPVDIGTSVDFTALLWSGAVGVEFGDPDDMTIEPFVGFRYLRADADLNWSFQGPLGGFPQTGGLSQRQERWDGIAGVRGRLPFGETSRWSATYYADVGSGDSDLTWQLVGGIGYAYGWGDLRFGWRHLAYESKDQGLLRNLSLTGPTFGATFRF